MSTTTTMLKPQVCMGCPLYDAKGIQPIGANATVDILVIGSKPYKGDIQRRPFESSGSSIVRHIYTEYLKELPLNGQPTVGYTYAVQCDSEKLRYKINADLINKCNNRLMLDIEKVTPLVIVPIGADALHALGFTGGINAYRGNIYTREFAGKPTVIVPTFAASNMKRSPGLLETFKKDIRKSITIAMEGQSGVEFKIMCPRDRKGIFAALDTMEQEIEAKYQESKKRVAVAIDTETTSLKPWLDSSRMIAMSFCWDKATNRGLALPLEHKSARLSITTQEQICTRVEQILGNPEKVAVVMHNGKFDIKFIKYAYGIQLPDLAWDTLLGEHLIDEDKKGVYGLKQLTRDWFPGAGKYEDELQAHMNNLLVSRKAKAKDTTAQYLDALGDIAVPYWSGLSEDERLHKISDWVASGAIGTFNNKLIELEYRKATKKQQNAGVAPALYKRTITLVTKLFNELPENELPEEIASTLQQFKEGVAEFEHPTYEDIPIRIMLRYAAIDAVMTLKILGKQLDVLAAEKTRLLKLQTEVLHKRLTNWPGNTWGYLNVSLPLTELLTEMEYKGVRLDRDKIVRYRDYLEEKAEETKENLLLHVGYDFNPKSTPDLCRILFEEMKLPVLKRSAKTKEPSTDANTLKELYDREPHPLLKDLLYFRKLEKCRSTYLDNWLTMSAEDGRLHTSFNVNGTATFRLSSSAPSNNLRGPYRSNPVLKLT